MKNSFTIGKNIRSRIKAGIYLEQNMRPIYNFAEHRSWLARYSSPQAGERDYYSKNLSVLNVSSFSD